MALEEQLGCWLHERWRTECALQPELGCLTRIRWQDLCNRNELLVPGDAPDSPVCTWEASSFLTVARVFPHVGGRLLRHCLRQAAVCLRDEPPPACQEPRLSVVLPVGGADRLPQFLAVLRSLHGQTEQRLEIIVVEHSTEALYRSHCSQLHHYLHLPCAPGQHFNKSYAMNAGVRVARAAAVLFHDADAVVPRDYVGCVLQCLAAGWDAVRPLRFIFHLDGEASRLLQSGCPERIEEVALVQQNNPGISTACTTQAYWGIGGHDERFEGWGGEDVEFLSRLATRRLFRGSCTFALHLWHPAAAKKASGDRNAGMLASLLSQSPAARVAALGTLRHG